jgi:phage terminase large subunit-like protein
VRRREQTNLPRYHQYAHAGYLTITPGTCNDYRIIHAFLKQLRESFNLKTIVFDQCNAIEMAAELLAGGFLVERQPQYHRHYSGPMKEFEVAVNEQRIRHDGNTLLKWALQNTRVDTNSFGDVKPSREKSSDKIDPCVSTLMAFGRAVSESVNLEQVESIYNSKRIIWV